jgi:ABC-2 type transport system ATP-binding protein
MITVANFDKAYDETIAVSGLSFSVEAGQILGLLGPNGAGKTTIIRAIAGVIPPTRGRLSVDGHNVVTDPVEAKRRLAYIPDDPKLFELLTVAEHLRFTAQAWDVPADLAAERTESLLRQFDLTAKRDTPAQELSRGMRQKVAICCAYLHAPDAIMFDEPLTGLDPRAIRTLKDSILKRAGEGAAIIVSSHLLSLVEDLCSHLLILNQGVCRFFGPLPELRSAFSEVSAGASLEDLFFHATDGEQPAEAPQPTRSYDDGAA